MHFRARVFHLVDEPDAFPRFASNDSRRYPMELVEIGAVVIESGTRGRRPVISWRMAAAKAWVACVGVRRARTLKQLNAPEVIIAAQTDARPVLQSLHETSLWVPSDYWRKFAYDNGAEQWIIALEPWLSDINAFRCWHALDDDFASPRSQSDDVRQLLTPSRN